MRRVVSISMAIVVAHALAAVALGCGTPSGGDRSTVSESPIVTNRTPHFSGDWKLDPGRSDPPPRSPGSDRGPGGPRPPRWPSRIHIEATPDLVSVEDSTGFVLEQIAIGGPVDDTTRGPSGAPHFDGSWFGDSLRVEHPGPDGAQVAEIFALAERGETLIIRTHLSRGEEQRQFKRVYQRVAN